MPISDALHEVLVELVRKRQLRQPQSSTELVFLGPRKKQILKRDLQRVWERLRARAQAEHGVRPLSLYAFRHTWVTTIFGTGMILSGWRQQPAIRSL